MNGEENGVSCCDICGKVIEPENDDLIFLRLSWDRQGSGRFQDYTLCCKCQRDVEDDITRAIRRLKIWCQT